MPTRALCLGFTKIQSSWVQRCQQQLAAIAAAVGREAARGLVAVALACMKIQTSSLGQLGALCQAVAVAAVAADPVGRVWQVQGVVVVVWNYMKTQTS